MASVSDRYLELAALTKGELDQVFAAGPAAGGRGDHRL